MSTAETGQMREAVVFKSQGLDIHGFLHEAGPSPAPAVVICHGAFESQENWFAYAERLNQDGFTALTFDFAGHGNSQGSRGLVNLKAWAYNIRDALSFLQTRGYHQFALVGWGISGSAALLAAAHDRRLDCIVSIATPIFLVPPLSERVAYGLLSVAARIKKSVLKKPLTLSRKNEFEEMRFAVDEAANERFLSNPEVHETYQAVNFQESLDSVWFDITQTVEKIKIPVLVVHGVEDKILPPDQGEKLYRLLNGRKKLEMIDGCGHAVHLDREKENAYKLIAKWLKHHMKT